MILHCTVPSPIGELLLASDGAALIEVHMEPHPRELSRDARRTDPRDDPVLRQTREQLDAYFAGELTAFALPLAARGTPFQQRVWSALRDIGYGETVSYGEVARRIGSPGAVRAVGAANGRNPIPIIVPCHRVVGADGSLTGFGGGIERKRWLIAHEARVAGLALG